MPQTASHRIGRSYCRVMVWGYDIPYLLGHTWTIGVTPGSGGSLGTAMADAQPVVLLSGGGPMGGPMVPHG